MKRLHWCAMVVAGVIGCGRGTSSPNARQDEATVTAPTAPGRTAVVGPGAVDLSPIELHDLEPCADVAACRVACERHDPNACRELVRDVSPSLTQWREGCRLGDGMACVVLARSKSEDDVALMRRARELLAASCTAGDARSCIDLMGREGVDESERARLLERACDLGVALPCRHIALTQDERAAELNARAMRIWITRCDRARDDVAGKVKAPGTCLEALALADELSGRYRDPVRARVLEIARPRCDGGDLAMCRVAATAMVMAGDDTGARMVRDRAASAAGRSCESGKLEGCRWRAELLSPDDVSLYGAAWVAWSSLRDDVRGADAWAKVCVVATALAGGKPMDPNDSIACERTRELGTAPDSLAPPPPPPPPRRKP